jgi:hypothetical protein
MMIFSKQRIGFALLAIGLLISVGAWNGILAWQGDDRGNVHVTYVLPHNRILFPTSFEMFEVPDYFLRYLIVGVFITSVGMTIVTPPFLKRLAGIEDDQR